MKSRSLRGRLVATTVLAVAVSGAASAQVAAGDPQTPPSTTADQIPPAAQAPQSEPERVVVTGSRLEAGFEAPTPVTTLGAEQLETRAPTTIADVINQLPAFRQTVTNTQTQRGNGNLGQNKVDLRGLGILRTLVLVDGRRWTPNELNGTIDVNLIPTQLVDRVDVVTGGASAAYGSDAVSGVVNFILKDRLEGVQGNIQYGESEEGDHREPAISLAAGTSFLDGRLHLVVGGDYSDNKGIGTIYTRDWGREQIGLVAFGSLASRGNLPAQGLVPNVTYATQAAGSLILSGPLKGVAFGPGGEPFNFNYGASYGTLMVGGGPNTGSPHGNPFGNWFIEAPHKRYTGYARVTYDIDDDTSAFLEYNYGHQEQRGLSSYHQNTGLVVPISNPFIPASIRTAMQTNGLTSITVGRYETDFGGYKLFDQDSINRFTTGLNGKVFKDWSWDAYWEHGEASENQEVYTNINEANYLAATYVVSGPNGAPVCGPVATNPNIGTRAAAVQPNCQPFNIFGPGSASQAALDYVKFHSNNQVRYKQDVVAANIRGEPFSTWAGPVSVAGGLEYRIEHGSSLADPLGAASAGLSNNGVTYAGKFDVVEGYLETGVPLLKDVFLAKALDLNAAVRETRYSTSGSVTTWKLGFTYNPIDEIRVRATRSRDIRAPNIAELYSAPTSGITATFLNPVTGLTGPEFTIGGGNPTLTPEIADTWTGGVVFQPTWSWLKGFNISLDYFKVSIGDVIATVAATDIASRCAQGIQTYCALMSFDPATGLTIKSIPANLNKLETDGLDLEASYSVPIDAIGLPGDLDIRSLTTWVDDLTTTDAVSAIDRAGSGINGGTPSYTSNLNFNYRIGPSSTNLQFRYTSSLKADATLIGPGQPGYSPSLPNSINKNLYPSAVYVDLTQRWTIYDRDGKTVQAYAGVTNLMNKQPPYAAIIAFINGGDPYDLIGRTYKVGLRFNF